MTKTNNTTKSNKIEENIKLNNVKISDFASHETLCFEAVLNVYGYDVALVENDGQGGCHKYTIIGNVKDSSITRNRVFLQAVTKYAISLDPEGFEQLDDLIYSMISSSDAVSNS